MMFVIKILGLLAGLGCIIVGLLIYFAGSDNSDAFAMQQLIAFAFLGIGAILLVPSILALVL